MQIIKIGGGADINTEGILKGIAQLNEPCIVVHGANACRDALATQLGKPTQTLHSPSGYSSVRTDSEAMDIFMMAYAGVRNKRLVESAQKIGLNAIGLTGIDGQLIRGKRNQAIRAKINGKIKVVRDDYSGKPKSVNTKLLMNFISQGLTPLICPPILGEEGHALNTENDSIVDLLIRSLDNITRVIHFFEAPGLMQDLNQADSLIQELHKSELSEAETKYTQGRMRRKMLAVRKAMEGGAQEIIFADGRTKTPFEAIEAGHCTRIYT